MSHSRIFSCHVLGGQLIDKIVRGYSLNELSHALGREGLVGVDFQYMFIRLGKTL